MLQDLHNFDNLKLNLENGTNMVYEMILNT